MNSPKPTDLAAIQLLLSLGPSVKLTSTELIITPYKGMPVALERDEVDSIYAGLWVTLEQAMLNGANPSHTDYAEMSSSLISGVVTHILEPGFTLDETSLRLHGMEGLLYREDKHSYRIWGDLYEITYTNCGKEVGGVRRFEGVDVSAQWLDKFYPGAISYAQYLMDMGVTDPVELGKSVYSAIAANTQAEPLTPSNLPDDLTG